MVNSSSPGQFQGFESCYVPDDHERACRHTLVIVVTRSAYADVKQSAVLGVSFGFKSACGSAVLNQSVNYRHGGFSFGFWKKGDSPPLKLFNGPAEYAGEGWIDVFRPSLHVIDRNGV